MEQKKDIENIRPDWIDDFVTADFESDMKSAISAAEKKCSLEFFPVVTLRSTTIGHVFPILSLLFVGLVLLSFEFYIPHWRDLYLLVYKIIFCFSAVFLAKQASKVLFIQGYLTAITDKVYSVNEASKLEYYQNKIYDHDSVMLYISIMEHQVRVLCKPSVQEKIGQDVLDAATKRMAKFIKEKNIQEALKDCMLELAGQLEETFPAQSQKKNIFKDEVKLKN